MIGTIMIYGAGLTQVFTGCEIRGAYLPEGLVAATCQDVYLDAPEKGEPGATVVELTLDGINDIWQNCQLQVFSILGDNFDLRIYCP